MKMIHRPRRGWELGLFSLKKRREGLGELVHMYKYLVAGNVKVGGRCSVTQWQDRQWAQTEIQETLFNDKKKLVIMSVVKHWNRLAHTGC